MKKALILLLVVEAVFTGCGKHDGGGSYSGEPIIPEAEAGAIVYTTSNGNKAYLAKYEAMGGNIIKSHSYKNGIGRITLKDNTNMLCEREISDGSKGYYSIFYTCINLYAVALPPEIARIDFAFEGCTKLKHVVFSPDTKFTSIGKYAFYCCTNLESFDIPQGISSIGDSAFGGCESLKSVSMPSGLTSIGWDAFMGDSSLTSVDIPSSVTSIGDFAFNDCSSLATVYVQAANPPTGGVRMFSGNAQGRKIYVPRSSVEAYKAAPYWSEYAASIAGYDF